MDIKYLRTTKDPDYVHDTDVTEPVECCNDEVRAYVCKWAGNEGWSLCDFGTIAELLGFTLPITLDEWNSKEKTFAMKSNTKVARIKLRRGDGMDYFSEMKVANGSRRESYSIYSKDGDFYAMLESVIEEKAGKTLKSCYSPYYCSRVLELPNGYQLHFNVSEPGGGSFKETEAKVFKHCDKINQYLFGIPEKCDNLDANLMFSELMNLYKFSESDIASAEGIHFKFMAPKDCIKSEKLVKGGKCVRFVETIWNETYEVCANGKWSYKGDGMHVSYNPDHKEYERYKVCLTGEDICVFYKVQDEIVQKLYKIEKTCTELMMRLINE